MLRALNMELEVVRTVQRGDLCEVSVYRDTLGDMGGLYTVVSIFSRAIRREIAGRMATSGLFAANGDFIGSFTYLDTFNLVFAYHDENLLSGRERLYASNFAGRKALAISFLTALAETQLESDVGRLLLDSRNVNVTPTGKVYLNYYLDFARLDAGNPATSFYRDAGLYAFDILASAYKEKHDGQVEMYPNELRLFYKKLQNRGFKSLSQIIAFVRELPDEPKEQRFGIMRAFDWVAGIVNYIRSHPTGVFLGIVLVITSVYLVYQLALRWTVNRDIRENTVYIGMENIGEVYLGEENI